jgi:hypothetical protein
MMQDSARLGEALLSFQGKLDQYQRLLESTGKKVYRSQPAEAKRLLATLTEPLLAVMDRRLSTEISILEQILAAGEPATDSKRQLWRFLKGNNLTPYSDIFDKIEERDMIQIFSREQLMLFSSTDIYDFISLTLEQLFTMTWYECTVREPAIEQGLAKSAIDMLSGMYPNTVCPGIPAHFVQEVNTEKCFKTQMLVKWISPLFTDGQVSAFVAILTLSLA